MDKRYKKQASAPTKAASRGPNSTEHPSVGVVVPVLNEALALRENLEALLADTDIAEIVVVDGRSTDGTQRVMEAIRREAAGRGDHRIRLRSAQPGRGTQMNVGARALSTDWIIFHHADSLLPVHAGRRIARLPSDVIWGGFTQRFIPSNWKLACISALHNWRCKISGAIYGDQSMFIRRVFFNRLGGFPEEPLEDMLFSDIALEQAPSTLLAETVDTDSRKFTQVGEFKALAQVVSIMWRFQRSRYVGHEAFFLPYR